MPLKSLATALLAVLITLVVYLPALQNGFVNWDDHIYVYENEGIRSLSLNFLKQSFTSPYFRNWHPLTMISYALDYTIWGLNPAGYHLTNILFHAANTLLVFVLVVNLIECKPNSPIPLFIKEGVSGRYSFSLIAGFVTALLFGIHPIHVESVVWVSERKDVLFAFFYLLSVISYLRYTEGRRAQYYIASLFLFMLALMSKPMAVSLPIVLVILDFYPLKRFNDMGGFKIVLIEKLPFLALSLVLSIVTIWVQGEALYPITNVPFVARMLLAIHALIFYLLKMLLPVNLAPFYPFPQDMDPFAFDYVGSLFILLATVFYCLWSGKRREVSLAAFLYYLGALFPVLGFVQVGGQFAADRYTYLPSLGPFLIAGLGMAVLLERCGRRRFFAAVVASMLLICGIFLYKTVKQIGVWRDSESLWSYEIRIFPDTAAVAYNNRGQAYMEKRAYYDAIDDFKRAMEINPRLVDAQYNLGIAYSMMGQVEEGVRQIQAAIQMKPNNPVYYNRLGNVYLKQMRFDEAIRNHQTAIGLKPESPAYHNDLANAYYKMGRFDDAIKEYEVAIRLKPDFLYAHFNLGKVYIAKGLKDKAREEFEASLKIDPGFSPASQELSFLGY